MSIVRVEKREYPFVQIDKEPLKDAGLSWKAKGLLAYLLSRPDDWEVHPKQLQGVSTDGRDATYAALRELGEAGYIEKQQRRGEDGHFTGTEYVVYERPLPPSDRDTENPDTESPDTDSPDTDCPDTENPSFTNKEETKKEGTKGSGGGSARPRGDSAGDSVPDADDVGVSVSLDFLPEEYSVYQSGIQALLDAYDSDQPDELVKREWQGARFNFHSVVDLARDHEWAKFVAAVVVTGDQADTPNARYLESLLDSFDTDQPNESDEQPDRPDDPKQRPADNHERIAAAVASASGE